MHLFAMSFSHKLEMNMHVNTFLKFFASFTMFLALFC